MIHFALELIASPDGSKAGAIFQLEPVSWTCVLRRVYSVTVYVIVIAAELEILAAIIFFFTTDVRSTSDCRNFGRVEDMIFLNFLVYL